MKYCLVILLIFSSSVFSGGEEKEKPDGTGIGGGGFKTQSSPTRSPSSIETSDETESDDLITILDGELDDDIETINVSNTSYNEIIEQTQEFAKKCKGENHKGGIYSQSYTVKEDKACLRLTCAKSIEAHEDKDTTEAKICFKNDVYKKVKSLKAAKALCKDDDYKGQKIVWDKKKNCAKVHCKLNISKEAGKEVISKLEDNKLKTPLVLKYCKADSEDEKNKRSTASNNKPHVNEMSPYMQKPKPTMILKGKDSHKGRWNTSNQ